MNPQNQPFIPPPITPESGPAPTPETPAQPQPQNTSHVTAAPEAVPGENYNPRMRAQYSNEPKVVHESRALDIEPFEISDKVKKLHDDSRSHYPHLNLSAGEFIILDIKRHPIGLIGPLFVGGIMLLAFVLALIVYPSDSTIMGLPSYANFLLIGSLFMVLVGIGVYVATWIYLQNQFYLTNESVIQEIQTSLFSRREQMVSLGSIEDASFHQHGILQTMFNYGTIRLSTEGDETTYRFSYVASPRNQVSTVSNAIESFKNGRPFDMNDDVN